MEITIKQEQCDPPLSEPIDLTTNPTIHIPVITSHESNDIGFSISIIDKFSCDQLQHLDTDRKLTNQLLLEEGTLTPKDGEAILEVALSDLVDETKRDEILEYLIKPKISVLENKCQSQLQLYREFGLHSPLLEMLSQNSRRIELTFQINDIDQTYTSKITYNTTNSYDYEGINDGTNEKSRIDKDGLMRLVTNLTLLYTVGDMSWIALKKITKEYQESPFKELSDYTFAVKIIDADTGKGIEKGVVRLPISQSYYYETTYENGTAYFNIPISIDEDIGISKLRLSVEAQAAGYSQEEWISEINDIPDTNIRKMYPEAPDIDRRILRVNVISSSYPDPLATVRLKRSGEEVAAAPTRDDGVVYLSVENGARYTIYATNEEYYSASTDSDRKKEVHQPIKIDGDTEITIKSL